MIRRGEGKDVRLGYIRTDRLPNRVVQLHMERPDVRWRWERFSMGQLPLATEDERDRELAREYSAAGCTPEEIASALHLSRKAAGVRGADIENAIRIASEVCLEEYGPLDAEIDARVRPPDPKLPRDHLVDLLIARMRT